MTPRHWKLSSIGDDPRWLGVGKFVLLLVFVAVVFFLMQDMVHHHFFRGGALNYQMSRHAETLSLVSRAR